MRYLIFTGVLFVAVIMVSCIKVEVSDNQLAADVNALAPEPEPVPAQVNVISTAEERPQPEPEEEPLLLDDEPLMLDDAPLLLGDGAAVDESELLADNSRCHVCHMNYTFEDVAVNHAKQGIGCVDCHGESQPHIDDESWASGGNGTAPDDIYTLDQVNDMCMACHPTIVEDEMHQPVLAGEMDEKYCTDCHGEHRLAHRVTKWK